MKPTGPPFSLALSRALGKVIVHVRGPLNARTSRELRHRLVDVIDGRVNRHLVLDLSATTLIDPIGYLVLLDASARMHESGGELVLSGPTPDVALGLGAAGLDKVFVVTPAWAHPSLGHHHSD